MHEATIRQLPLRDDGRLGGTLSNRYAASDEEESLLGGWHANLILLQRRQCVLFVQDTTRFPVFVPALKKVDFGNLDRWFKDGFINTLPKTGADEAILNRAKAVLGPLVCDTDCDRSVQGTLNQVEAGSGAQALV